MFQCNGNQDQRFVVRNMNCWNYIHILRTWTETLTTCSFVSICSYQQSIANTSAKGNMTEDHQNLNDVLPDSFSNFQWKQKEAEISVSRIDCKILGRSLNHRYLSRNGVILGWLNFASLIASPLEKHLLVLTQLLPQGNESFYLKKFSKILLFLHFAVFLPDVFVSFSPSYLLNQW